MQRDYRAEAVGIGSGVRVSRDGTEREQRDLFLPTAKDFAKPSDPDGEKGLRAWADSKRPAPGNNRPLWPDMKKRVY